MDSNKMIGERIGKLLVEKEITQQQLADSIGVKRETIVQWLNGTRKIKAEHIIMLCSALNVSADHLLFGNAVKSRDPEIKVCCSYTGLSEDALKKIHSITEADPDCEDALSTLISTNHFSSLINRIADLQRRVTECEREMKEVLEKETEASKFREGIQQPYSFADLKNDEIQAKEAAITSLSSSVGFYCRCHEKLRLSVYETEKIFSRTLENAIPYFQQIEDGLKLLSRYGIPFGIEYED